MSTEKISMLEELRDAVDDCVKDGILKRVDAPIEPPVNLDEIRRRYPPDISEEDFKRLIEHERNERAGWVGKQDKKGKEE